MLGSRLAPPNVDGVVVVGDDGFVVIIVPSVLTIILPLFGLALMVRVALSIVPSMSLSLDRMLSVNGVASWAINVSLLAVGVINRELSE